MKSLIENKRGDFTGILYLIVMIAGMAFFLLVVGYIATEVSTNLQDQIGSDDTRVNNSFETTRNVARGTLSAIWYVVFGGLLLGLLITAWYMPTHPIMVAPFIVLLIIAIIIGVAMSNAYEDFYDVEQFENISETQGSINFMMSNLPYLALVIGIIGLIVTFAKPKDQGGTPLG